MTPPIESQVALSIALLVFAMHAKAWSESQRAEYAAQVMRLAESCDVGERAFYAKLAGDTETMDALVDRWNAFEVALMEQLT